MYYNIHIDKDIKKTYEAKLSEINNQLAVIFKNKKKGKKGGILKPSYIALLFNNYIFSFLYHFIFVNNGIKDENYETIAEELVNFFLYGYKSYIE